MPPFARKKVYANRCIREITMESRMLAPVAQITIMIILVVPTTMQIRSTIPVGWVGQTTMQIWSTMPVGRMWQTTMQIRSTIPMGRVG